MIYLLIMNLCNLPGTCEMNQVRERAVKMLEKHSVQEPRRCHKGLTNLYIEDILIRKKHFPGTVFLSGESQAS